MPYARARNWLRAAGALALLGSLCPFEAAAEIPETISYQAVLKDDAGVLVDGQVDLTFRIYDALTGGNLLWTETHPSVDVQNGLLDLKLGAITPFRNQPDRDPMVLSSDNLLFNIPYYLSVQVGSDPEMSPRLELSSAPYAFNGPGLAETIVDCTGAAEESIQDVIDNSVDSLAGGVGSLLLVSIDGVCDQNVDIRRDNVVLRGVNLDDGGPTLDPPIHGIVGQIDGAATVSVRGATGVVVRNLVIETRTGSGFSDTTGVHVRANGYVRVVDSVLADSDHAVMANDGGFAEVVDSDLEGNETAASCIQSGVLKVHDSDLTVSGGDATVIGSRLCYMRFTGATTVVNDGVDGVPGNADDGQALSIANGVQVRQDNGHTEFNGSIWIGRQSQAALRDPEITAKDIGVDRNSLLSIRATSEGAPNPTISGAAISVTNRSNVVIEDDVTGTITSLHVNAHSSVDIGSNVDLTTTLGGSDAITLYGTSTLNVGGGTTLTGNIHFNTNSQLTVNGSGTELDGDVLIERRSSLDMFGSTGATITGNVTLGGFGGGYSDANVDGVTLDGGTLDCGAGLPNVMNGTPTLINGASVVNC